MKGTIYKGIGGFYYVMTEELGSVECKARGKFRRERIIPMIGDEVEIEVKNGKGSINEIYPRRSKLIRPAVANIDMIVVVAAAKSPDPSTAVIDKMLVNAEINGIEPIVCVNKIDLADCSDLMKLYENAGYRTLAVSAEKGEGIEELYSLIRGRTAAFAGVSGVGKSSLLTLITGQGLETGSVSDKISRGRHTTRHVELFKIQGGGYVLDTPGFSSIEPEDVTCEELSQCFPEMRELTGQCRFRGCAHIGEPDCAVKEMVRSGKIAASRYESYKELYEIQRSRKQWT
ncbi:MAG: ribosome small subunit-dependent GTPase A [Oscillospiraceae bacterium]|nr:ribosome small subunit-dependent GTPase A [Oscillospiraceae bacterium]